MKTLVIFFALGLSMFGNAQKVNTATPIYELDESVVTKNANYLNMVQDENTPVAVIDLQKKVVSFDLVNARGFDKKMKIPYEVVFQIPEGKIVAFYDPSGKVLSTFEKFKDITLPKGIRDQVWKDNQPWKMVSNKYITTYDKDKLIKRFYNVRFNNGKHYKNVVVNLKN